MKYSSIIRKEKEIIEKSKATVTVCDGRFSAIIASGFYLGLPTIYVTNQTSVSEKLLKNRLQRIVYKKPLDILTKASSLLSDEIVIPDFPPPLTISSLLLSKSRRIKKKLIFSGPLIREEIETTKPLKLKKPAVLVLTGGHSYRNSIIRIIIEASKVANDIHFVVISRLIERKVERNNLLLLPFVKNVFSYMKSADIIVTHGGHSTLMEAIACKKNTIVIPDINQPEQFANAKGAEKLKISKMIRIEKLSKKSLVKQINNLLNDKRYKKRVYQLAKLAEKLKGREEVASRIVKLSEKMLRRW